MLPENETVTADDRLVQVGKLIEAARQRAQMTQAMLAGQIGITQAAVSRWEAGERDPGIAGLLLIAEAVCVPASSLLPVEHQAVTLLPEGGQWMEMSFLGHDDVTGYVTDITLGGEPAFHIDLPDKVWGGNPLSWEEWSVRALRRRGPVDGESVRRAWEARRRAAALRAADEAEWRRMQEQRALTAGSDDDGVWPEDDDGVVPF
jgi:transcriptional regulator with XRE-family HTH domain